MLTDDEIESMRCTVEQALPDRASIERPTLTADGAGGQTLVWTAIATRVPIRVAALDSTAQVGQELASRASTEKRWMITLPAGTDLQGADRILVGDRTFGVDSISSDRSYELDVRALVAEVE